MKTQGHAVPIRPRFMRLLAATLAAQAAFQALPAGAAGCAGSLDPSFQVPADFPTLWSDYPPILMMTVQPDGKVLVVDGRYNWNSGQIVYRPPIRFLANGALDTNYVANPADVSPHTRVTQADGKVVALLPGTNGASAKVVRYNQDGSLDMGFVADLHEDFQAAVVALQPGEGILVGGGLVQAQDVGGWRRTWVAEPVVRLLENGARDTSFISIPAIDNSPDSLYGSDCLVRDMVVGPDGKIYICGFFTRVGGMRRTDVARLNADGTLDLSFEPDIAVCVGCDVDAQDTVSALGLTPDGKLMIAGRFTTINGVGRHAMARLYTSDADCAGVIAFASTNLVVDETNALATVTVLRLGSAAERVSVRYQTLTNGYPSLPEAAPGDDYAPQAGVLEFAPGETTRNITIPLYHDWLCEPNERIGLSLSEPTGGALLRMPAVAQVLIRDVDAAGRPGNVDEAFQPALSGSLPWDAVHAAAADAQSVWVSGVFDRVDGVPRNGFARLHLDGRLDPGFDPAPDGQVLALAADSAQRMLVGGNFTNIAGFSHIGLARFNLDGSSDETFHAPPIGTVRVICLQPDGKILAGGAFGVVRLNENGTPDTSFHGGTSVWTQGDVQALAVQPNGQVLAGGFFDSIEGQPMEDLARLNADGSLDLSFFPVPATNSGFIEVLGLAAQLDGKVLVGGYFDNIQGQRRTGLARLYPDGTLDTTFDPGPCGIVYSVVLQADGKILVAAENQSPPNRAVMRLLPEGTLDPSFFAPGLEPWLESGCLALQPNGDVLIGGAFRGVNGLPRPGLARLHGDSTGVRANDPGSISFSAPVYQVAENGGMATIKVQRLWGSCGAVSARFETRDETATAGADYVATSAEVAFVDGEAGEKTISIPILDDQLGEDGGETVRLVLSEPTGGATLGSFAAVPLTIVEDDEIVEFAAPAVWVSETNSGLCVWFMVRGKRDVPVTVEYATHDGTAKAWLDYVPVTGTATLSGSGAGLMPWITLLNDDLVDGIRAFSVSLRIVAGTATLGTNATIVVNIIDDEPNPNAVERRLPPVFVPGEPFTVTILAHPAGTTTTYAVEEALPAGWGVGDISDSGQLDVVNSKLVWGPFLDHAWRALSYRITPQPGASDTVHFLGTGSFNDISIPTSGSDTCSEACRLLSVPSAGTGEWTLRLRGRVGARFQVESSADLQSWTVLTIVTNTQGFVEFSDPDRPSHGQRFYRSRMVQ